jgi:hypothetical protein
MFHSKGLSMVLPVRCAEIIAAESFGETIYVRFAVHGFAFPRTAAPGSSEQLSALSAVGVSALGERHCGRDQLAGRLSRHLYFKRSDSPISNLEFSGVTPRAMADAWNRVVSLVTQDPVFSGMPLLHVLGFQELDKRDWGSRYVQPDQERGGVHILTSGKRYRLRVLERSVSHGANASREGGIAPSTPPGPVPVECAYDAVHLKLEGESNLVVGGYDVLEYSISARQRGRTEIGLRLPDASHDGQPGDGGGPKGVSYQARVPVEVGRNWRRICASGTSALLGLALFALTEGSGGWIEMLSYPAMLVALGASARTFELLFGSSKIVERNPVTDAVRPPGS